MTLQITSSIMLNIISLPTVYVGLFLSVIIILLYLYFTSTILHKKLILILVAASLVLAVVLNFVVAWKMKQPAIDFRLTILPVQISSQNDHLRLAGEALWEMINYQLKSGAGNRAIINDPDFINTIINRDSIYQLNYLQQFNRRISAEYLLLGKTIVQENKNKIEYQLMNTSEKAIKLARSRGFTAGSIAGVSHVIVTEILEYFKLPNAKLSERIHYIEMDSFEKYLQAKQQFNSGCYQDAIESTKKSLALDSNLVENKLLLAKSWFNLALAKKKAGEAPIEAFQQSFDWLNQIIADDSSNGEAFCYLGEIYIYRERWSLADAALKRALELSPNFPRTYLALSRLHPSRYQKLGFTDEIALFQRALFLNPGYEQAALMLGDHYLFDNKRQKAINVLKKHLEINPDSVPVLMALGKIYLLRNEILNIIDVYNRVIALDPDNSAAYYNLGILYYNSEDFENAEKFFRLAIEIDNHLNAHLYLAYLYDLKGDRENAIKYLRLRIRHRTGLDDEFAEEARRRLYDLMHGDSTGQR